MSSAKVAWPLARNLIRGKSERNTFGVVRKFANGSPRPHQGWDFAAAVGITVYAVGDGKVEYIKNTGDYGVQLCLSFALEGTTYAFYAHLQRTLVSVGAAVEKKDAIGITGNSGDAKNLPAAEDHLHFEIRTSLSPGAGLAGRISPLKIYGRCPLTVAIVG